MTQIFDRLGLIEYLKRSKNKKIFMQSRVKLDDCLTTINLFWDIKVNKKDILFMLKNTNAFYQGVTISIKEDANSIYII